MKRYAGCVSAWSVHVTTSLQPSPAESPRFRRCRESQPQALASTNQLARPHSLQRQSNALLQRHAAAHCSDSHCRCYSPAKVHQTARYAAPRQHLQALVAGRSLVNARCPVAAAPGDWIIRERAILNYHYCSAVNRMSRKGG